MEIRIENKKGKEVQFTNGLPFTIAAFTDSGIPVSTFSSSGMYQKGETYLGNRLEKRQLTLQYYLCGEDASELAKLKKLVYEVLDAADNEITVYYTSDSGREYRILAIPDTIPAYKAQTVTAAEGNVNLLCCAPMWEGEEVNGHIALWKGMFHFPMIIYEPVVFGMRQPSTIVNVINPGDTECGVRIIFTALGRVLNPSLTNVTTYECLKLNQEMQEGDVITISTGFGKKRIELANGGIRNNILNKLDLLNGNGAFIQVQKGDNLLRYHADEYLENLDVRILFSPAYYGTR